VTSDRRREELPFSASGPRTRRRFRARFASVADSLRNLRIYAGCVSPVDARDRIAPARFVEHQRRPHLLKTGGRNARRYQSVLQPRRGFSVWSAAAPVAAAPERSSDCARPSCCNRKGRAQNGDLRQTRRHYTAAAGSDDAHDASAYKGYRRLAQVTTPRDGLPDPSSSWTGQRGLSSRPLPAGSVQRRAEEALPEPWVNGSSRWTDFPQESAIDAKNGCSRGKQQQTLHESGVVSRVPRRSRHAQRSGRTETLTGQALHTSSGSSSA